MGDITTMRELIIIALAHNNETWADIEAIEITLEHYDEDASNYPVNHYTFSKCGYEDMDEDSPDIPKLKDLSVDDLLDKEFYDGYGSPCPINPIVWTKNHIYYHHEYDGADSIRSLPRQPKGIDRRI